MDSHGTILVGTIGQGVMMSGDDGATWTRASVRMGMHSDCIVKALCADSRRPEVVYAGTDLGLYRSDDGGGTWRLLDTPMTGSMVWSLAIDPRDARVMFAGTGTPSTPGVYRSTDDGKSWEHRPMEIAAECPAVGIPRVTAIAIDPTDDRHVWAGIEVDGVRHSTDGGDTWSECEHLRTLPDTKEWTFPGPPYVSHLKGLAVSADLPDVVIGAIEEGWVVRSTDNGKTWHNIKQGVEFDAHSVCYMPNDPAVVIVTSGKGVYRSGHGGDAFEDASEGLDRRYMAQIAVHAARPNVLFTAAAAVPPPSWRRPQGADAGFFRSEDQARSWQRVTGGLPELIKGAPRATASDPNDPNTFLVGLTDGTIWISEDGTESFREVVGGLGQISSLAVARQ